MSKIVLILSKKLWLIACSYQDARVSCVVSTICHSKHTGAGFSKTGDGTILQQPANADGVVGVDVAIVGTAVTVRSTITGGEHKDRTFSISTLKYKVIYYSS